MTTRTAFHVFSIAACAACLVLANVATAQTAAKKTAVAPRAKAASAVMTKDELKQCLDQQQSLRAEGESLDKDRTSLAAAKAAIEKRSAELADRLALLDRTSASAVDAHNVDVGEREKSVDAFQVQVDAFNSRAVAARDHQQAFEKACGNKQYEVRDENALRKAR